MTHFEWAVLILLGLNLLAKLLDVRVHWGKLPSGLKWVPAAKVFDYDYALMHQCGGELFIKGTPGYDAPNVGDFIQQGIVRRKVLAFSRVWTGKPRPEYTVKLDQLFDYEDYDDGS